MQPTEKYYEHDAYRREAGGHILAESLWFDRKVPACFQRAKTLRWARGREGCSDSPLPTSGLHPPRNGPRAARP